MIFHAWLLYPFPTLTCWWYWLILLIVLAYWFCSCHDYPTHFDMYVHFFVSLICFSVDYLACILSWSYLNLLSLLLFILIVIFLFSLCVEMDDILVLRLTACCMTALFLSVCMLLVYVGHTSIPLPPTLSFRSFPSFWFLHLQVWGLMCAYFSYRASWLGVGSSDRLYRCLGAFWRRWTYWHWLESDVWQPV